MAKEASRDRLYAEPRQYIADFAFDKDVAHVFADMIRRSVPGYGAVLGMLPAIATQFVQPHSVCFDLGCSLGASTLAVRKGIQAEGCRIVAIDNAPAMVARCEENVAAQQSPIPVDVICGDVRDVAVENASLVIFNFTLQFIPVDERDAILSSIAAGMRPGSALVLSEKIRFEEDDWQGRATAIHHQFKQLNGYTELEISQKRTALENVMIPETEATHLNRLRDAGFKEAHRWFQCVNFASYLALK